MRPVFALFMRSLRESLRIWPVNLARSGLLATVLTSAFFTRAAYISSGAPGLEFMKTLMFWNSITLILFGLSYFSSAITTKKEEGTLPLLRLTGLDRTSILLGLSTSRLAVTLLLFLSQLPLAVLAVTMGSVTLAQVITAYVHLMGFAVLLANICLYESVRSKNTGEAIVSSAWVIFVFSLCFHWFLPFWSIPPLLETGYANSIDHFTAPIANVVIAILFFLTSWGRFDVLIYKTEREAEKQEGGIVSENSIRTPLPSNNTLRDYLNGSNRKSKDCLPAHTTRPDHRAVYGWNFFNKD